MIQEISDILNHSTAIHPFLAVSHITIFTGAFYVTMFNKRLPLWHTTPLWYAGMASLFCFITIILQYIFGPTFPLAYDNIGVLGETFLNMSLACIAITFFVVTFKNRN
jgi:hypothetical protein